ncbi:MAG: putative sulfate exporter family transporter [Candidatus Chloroheliales bacterium]|nr:MAG: putative sulfate exporter family transporter [Chloroflexota bacterium]
MKQEAVRASPPSRWEQINRLAPGVALAVAIALAAWGLQLFEEWAIGRPIIEALVIAILLGMLWRNFVGLRGSGAAGVSFTAKQVLETAIVLLGAGVDLPTLLKAGPALLLAIVLLVGIGITASIGISRAIGLNPRLAILVAVGNSICGNSAIAAVAPVIQASADDIASAIALTAVLGVVVVLTLPLLIGLVGLSLYQYGVLAGMSVYAVPQVLAATFPVSAISGQIGTLVKLVRVLLLGPVVLFFSLRYPRATTTRFSLTRFVPWFIIGFLLIAALRSLGLLPAVIADPLRILSTWLTVAAMAALGLGVDIRAVRKVGLSVAGAVMASLLVLISVSLLLIFGLGIDASR